MKLLLDTHILLWALADDSRLPLIARKMIEDAENDPYYSILSLWEIELKRLAHPDKMPFSATEIIAWCEEAGFQLLPLKKANILYLETLQRAASSTQHKDPFDRMLICQAATDGFLLLTHDRLFSCYGEPGVTII